MIRTEISSAGDRNYEMLHFGWFLVDWCNYKCSYCSTAESMRETYSKSDSHSKYKLVLQRLARVETPYIIDLYGGEPTLHSEIKFIIEQLSSFDQCQRIVIRTNLSRSLEFLLSLAVSDKVVFSASYHPEHHTNDFITKCMALKSPNFHCLISMSDDPKHWDRILELISAFRHNGVQYMCNMLYSTVARKIAYSDEFYQIFKDVIVGDDYQLYPITDLNGTTRMLSSFQIHKDRLNNFKGFRCRAQMYTIDINGEIKNTCTASVAPLILKKDVVTQFQECPVDFCRCDDMFLFYKEKSKVKQA